MTSVLEREHGGVEPPYGEPQPRPPHGPPEGRVSVADRSFRGVLRGSGIFVLASCRWSGSSCSCGRCEALKVGGFSFITTAAWEPDAGVGNFGIAAVLVGTVLMALVAIFFAFPLALGTALYISEYAPAADQAHAGQPRST